MRHLKSQPARSYVENHDALTTTGPVMIDDVMRSGSWPDVFVPHDLVFSPQRPNTNDGEVLMRPGPERAALKRFYVEHGTYAIHYWSNSWAMPHGGDLHNPNPHDVPGYTFFPVRDSQWFDITYRQRNVDQLAAECSENPHAIGFNTFGCIKSYIRPRFEWIRIENPNGNEGLYIADQHVGNVAALRRHLLRLPDRTVRKIQRILRIR